MNAVIKPWLSAGLIVALAGNVLLSAVLILKLSRFDDTKKQAEEAEALAVQKRTELSTLQVEVESLTKRKDVLTPTVADWEKRLKEMHDAQATADSLNAKQRQAESDVAQVGKRLEDTRSALLDADKQKTDLTSTVERLKAERDALSKSGSSGMFWGFVIGWNGPGMIRPQGARAGARPPPPARFSSRSNALGATRGA